jgi:hypothetical protein
MKDRSTNCRLKVAALAALLAIPAQAGTVDDLAIGLRVLGFDLQGSHNLLSRGDDFLVTNTFNGSAVSFGLGELSLQGSLSASASTAALGLRSFDVSFQTAPDDSFAANPLNYAYNVDLGFQEAQVTGSALIDARLSLNQLGFYDLGLTYSSRQTVERSGALADDSLDFDVDLGPVNVSGNIYADILTALTDPFFRSSGATNPFAAFSGTAQLKQLVDAQTRTSIESITGPQDLADLQLIQQANTALIQEVIVGALIAPGASLTDADAVSASGRVVPEPAVAVLLLVGLPLLLRRRIRPVSI